MHDSNKPLSRALSVLAWAREPNGVVSHAKRQQMLVIVFNDALCNIEM